MTGPRKAPPPRDPASPWYRRPDAARYLGVSAQRLAALAVNGLGPKFRRPPGTRYVLYLRSDLDAWLGSPLDSTAAADARDSYTNTTRGEL